MRGFTIASLIVLVVFVAVVGIAAVLLARTVQEAQSINAKAQNIATTGRGINTATDSVIQLTRTNKLARSILKSATPLDTQLGGIVATAQGIDGLAGSINSTAGSINGNASSINNSANRINDSAGGINSAAGSINSTAGSINTSAGRINGSVGSINRSVGSINDTAGNIDSKASSILGTARQIDTDVRLINTNLDVTLSLVTAVKGDTGNILGQAGGANDTAACIDRKLFGQAGDDGDCQGQATPAASRRARAEAPTELLSPEELQELIPDAPPPSSGGDPAPEPSQPSQPRPAPRLGERLPDTSVEPLDKIIDGLALPGIGPDQGLPGGEPPNDLLNRLLP